MLTKLDYDSLGMQIYSLDHIWLLDASLLLLMVYPKGKF